MLRDVLYAVNFVIVIFVALALGIGGATMIAYLALLHRLQPHVRAIDEARMELVSLGGSIDTVAALLALAPWSPGAGREIQPDAVESGVRFDRVSFAYSGKDLEKRNALDEVSLEFPVGKMTAVVGWSGAGKTTLINLLFRFYDPSSGSITLNGVPLQQLDLDWWRSQLSIAGQDAELIGGTIRENIAYGKEGATFEEIVDAAKRASVHDFVSSLPLGYETRVGSRGVLLSGGQRQRIGLARALLRRQGILVLDEATNSLDSMTEAEVLRSLEELREQMTIIVIAHRLSTTRTADQVIALADGKVAEAGTPAELLRNSGLYSKMVQLQDLAELRGFALRPVDPEQMTN
jgi:subfamily B ATP-binding cassette protein MsbA